MRIPDTNIPSPEWQEFEATISIAPRDRIEEMGRGSQEEMTRAALEKKVKDLYGVNTILVSWVLSNVLAGSHARSYKVVYRKVKMPEAK